MSARVEGLSEILELEINKFAFQIMELLEFITKYEKGEYGVIKCFENNNHINSAVLQLYAKFEATTKNLFGLSLQYVVSICEKEQKKIYDLNLKLQTLYFNEGGRVTDLVRELNSSNDSGKSERTYSAYEKVLKHFYTNMNSEVGYEENVINTESNLTFKVFLKLLAQFDITPENYTIIKHGKITHKINEIIDKLTKRRNGIAHGDSRSGRYVIDDYKTLEDISVVVEVTLRKLMIDLECYCKEKLYLKK